MYYTIIISKDGREFFSTSQKSLNNAEDFEKISKVIKDKFPKTEGYQLSADYYSEGEFENLKLTNKAEHFE